MTQETTAQKICVICGGEFDEFRPFASRRRMVQCPSCKSIDRNRLLYLYLKNETDIFSGRMGLSTQKNKLLHIAPEKIFGKIFSNTESLDYFPVDLDPSRPFVREAMDIQNIHYPKDMFDYIICCHVMEHIPDDNLAMRNLARVLKPTGQCLIMVPLRGKTTVEDASYNTDELRRLHYGGVEHLRYYGLDIIDRLQSAGFSVTPLRYSDRFGPDDVARMGLSREKIFVCRRASSV